MGYLGLVGLIRVGWLRWVSWVDKGTLVGTGEELVIVSGIVVVL